MDRLPIAMKFCDIPQDADTVKYTWDVPYHDQEENHEDTEEELDESGGQHGFEKCRQLIRGTRTSGRWSFFIFIKHEIFRHIHSGKALLFPRWTSVIIVPWLIQVFVWINWMYRTHKLVTQIYNINLLEFRSAHSIPKNIFQEHARVAQRPSPRFSSRPLVFFVRIK